MSDVIRFLESMGSKPDMSPADYAATVALLDAEAPQREALLARNQLALNELLGGREKLMVMSLFPAEPSEGDEPEHENDQPDDEPTRETPSEQER